MISRRPLVLVADVLVFVAVTAAVLYLFDAHPLTLLAGHASGLRAWLAEHRLEFNPVVPGGTDGLVVNPPLDSENGDHRAYEPIDVKAARCKGTWTADDVCRFPQPESKYAESWLPIPFGAKLAKDTAERCGMWHLATADETCASLMARAGQSLDLFLAINPALAPAAGCDDRIVPGTTYCLLPVMQWTYPFIPLYHIVPGALSWGCWANSDVDRRVVDFKPRIGDAAMTPALCAKHCTEHTPEDNQYGGSIFAIANGTDCRCGDSLAVNSKAVDHRACDMPCAGDATQSCGGAAAVSLYSRSQVKVLSQEWERNGCYSIADGPALRFKAELPGTDGRVSEAHCHLACQGSYSGRRNDTAPYSYYGLANGGECWCGNDILSQAARVDDTRCDALCPTMRYEYCGGEGHMEIWGTQVNRTEFHSAERPSPEPPLFTFDFTFDFHFFGCYVEGRSISREPPPPPHDVDHLALRPSLLDHDAMSAAVCFDFCVREHGGDGFALANGRDCYCPSATEFWRAKVGNSRCDRPCSGAPSEWCGGANRTLNVYGVTPDRQGWGVDGGLGTLPVPNPSGLASHMGCVSDVSTPDPPVWGPPELTLVDATGMTLEACATFCVSRGSRSFFLETGTMCRCGQDGMPYQWRRFVRPVAECDVPCAGNSSQVCGGQDRLSWYQYLGTH